VSESEDHMRVECDHTGVAAFDLLMRWPAAMSCRTLFSDPHTRIRRVVVRHADEFMGVVTVLRRLSSSASRRRNQLANRRMRRCFPRGIDSAGCKSTRPSTGHVWREVPPSRQRVSG
jgi:hypothetical protein